ILIIFVVFSVFSVSGFLLYSKTLESPFIFDDSLRITENPDIRVKELSLKSIQDAAFGKQSTKERPIGNITFALNYYVHQYDLKGYHIFNITIHILTGIFLFLFIQITLNLPSIRNQYDSGITIAFFGALLWLVHPIQTQSVTYIVQRLNSLAALFYILAFWMYVRGRLSNQKKIKWIWFGGAALAWICALGSKQNTATLPFFLFLYEWYFFQELGADWLKRNLKSILLVVFIFAIIALLYLGLDPIERLSSIKDFANKEFTLSERVLTQFRVVVYYISLLFFPHPSRLNLDYDFPLSTSLIHPFTTLLSLLVIVGLIGLAIYLAKKERLISFCILWFFGNLVIESSIIPLAIIFEHRLYLPSMMVLLLPVVIVYRYIKLDWLKVGLLSLVVVGLAFWTYQRNLVWADKITLWTDVVKKSPNKARPHFNLGSAYSLQNQIDKAIPLYKRALEINPNLEHPHINLGEALERQNKVDEAMAHYQTALKIKPDLPEAHNNIGALLAKQGHTEEAIPYYQNALQIRPHYALAHFNLASALVEKGDIEQGTRHYYIAIEYQPAYAEAHIKLGDLFLNLGEREKAINHYMAALQIDPNWIEAYNNLGIALMQEGNIEAAIRQFQKALQLKPDFEMAENNLKRAVAIQKGIEAEIVRLQTLLKENPGNVEMHFQLGNLYYRKGDQRQAMEQYKRALQLNPKFLPALNNLALVTAANKEYYKALTVFLDLLNYAPNDAETHYNIACMYSRLNRVDEAIKWLQEAIDKGYSNWESIKRDGDLDNIRGSLAYKELIQGK
ncbi:MAG: tetratricopeptide repeat protein, partial [Desulfobacterales bacterium]